MKEKRGDAFSDCHPAVNFFWFAAVILITMLNSHPVFLGISFLGAFCYASRLQGWQRVLKFNLLATLPAMIIVAFINPAFNHYMDWYWHRCFLFRFYGFPVTTK